MARLPVLRGGGGSGEQHGNPSAHRCRRTYEDTEGLTTTLGVISALAFAFVVALQHQVSPATQHYADFRGLVCKSSEFRNFIVDVLDSGDFGSRTFNFTVPIAAGKVLDLRYELEVGIFERHNNESQESDNCLSDGLVAATVMAVYQEFPGYLLNVWYSQNPKEFRYSNHIELTASIAAALTFVSLLWSIILYISLSLSPAREDQTGECLRQWAKLGYPCVLLGYLILLAGLVLFFVSHVNFKSTQIPHYDDSEFNVHTAPFWIVIPVSCLGLLLAAVAIPMSRKGLRVAAAAEMDARTSEQAHGHTFRHDI